MVNVNDKLQVKAGSKYSWSKVTRIDSKTYLMPMFICTILHGQYASETVATSNYLDHAKPHQHIDHALPDIVNIT